MVIINKQIFLVNKSKCVKYYNNFKNNKKYSPPIRINKIVR